MVESFCRLTQLWIHGFLLFRKCACMCVYMCACMWEGDRARFEVR